MLTALSHRGDALAVGSKVASAFDGMIDWGVEAVFEVGQLSHTLSYPWGMREGAIVNLTVSSVRTKKHSP